MSRFFYLDLHIKFLKRKCLGSSHDYIDIDDIGNLEDSPRLKFIDEECGNLIVVRDGRELTININQKKKSDISQ